MRRPAPRVPGQREDLRQVLLDDRLAVAELLVPEQGGGAALDVFRRTAKQAPALLEIEVQLPEAELLLLQRREQQVVKRRFAQEHAERGRLHRRAVAAPAGQHGPGHLDLADLSRHARRRDLDVERLARAHQAEQRRAALGGGAEAEQLDFREALLYLKRRIDGSSRCRLQLKEGEQL